jgi:multidrug resistance efflux pump
MKRLLTGFAAMLVAGAAAGQILECVDAKGNKEYAQTCPPGTAKETQMMKGGTGASSPGTGTSAPAAKSQAERDLEFRKRNIERQEAEAKAEKAKAASNDAERNCNNARAQLKGWQDGLRIVRVDPSSGDRSYFSDEERTVEMANAQKAVNSWCNK